MPHDERPLFPFFTLQVFRCICVLNIQVKHNVPHECLPTKHKDGLRRYKTVLNHLSLSNRWIRIVKDRLMQSYSIFVFRGLVYIDVPM